MNKKSMSIDLDWTLNNLNIKLLEIYNKDYKDNLTFENMINWEIDTIVKPECGKKIFDYFFHVNFFKNLDIQPYAQEVTKWLSNYFNLYIITAYHPKVCLDKAEWIAKYLPHIPIENIIFCNKKGLIKTNFLIDDGGHNIIDYHNNYKSGIPIIFDAPWNRYLKNKFIRVYDWLEIKEVIKELL